MKKLCTVFFTLLLLAFASVASANYPYYLNGNSDYVRVDGRMGTAWYVDKTSLVNQMYAPPYYKLAINVVTAQSATGDENDFYNGGEGEIVGVKTYYFYYNLDSDRMCVLDNNGDWRYLDPQGSWAATGVALPAGQMAFELAYGRSFY